MDFRKLGNTDIDVSVICLGTMTWGVQNSEPEAHAQLDHAIEAGVNFIDTAELYAIPPTADSYGQTERYIGSWLKARNKRNDIVLATKVVGHSNWLPHIREGKANLDRGNITAALDASLTRLQTDYIDLYQLHWPDRNTNFFGKLGYQPGNDTAATPIAETLAVLGELVEAGKIRHIGLSNETPWGAMQFLKLAEQQGMPRVVSIQNPYNLLNRTYEIGLAEISHREQIGLLAYSPLGFGVLSGKYLNGARPEGARLCLYPDYQRYTKGNGIVATQAYVELAQRHGLDPAQMALAFVRQQPFVTSTIVGATSLAQLQSNLASHDVVLSEEVLQDIEAIHVRYPNPSP